MERLNLLGRFGGSTSYDWPSYQRVMSKPTRHYLLHAITATRSYQEGLNAVVHLLRLTEAKRTKLSRDEYQTNSTFLNYSVLDLLDRMDRWEEYLAVWERLRRRTKVVSISRVEMTEATPDDETVYADVLLFTRHRKELIERKLQRKQAGQKLGNVLHARPEELSEEEISERLERILGWWRRGELWISTLPC